MSKWAKTSAAYVSWRTDLAGPGSSFQALRRAMFGFSLLPSLVLGVSACNPQTKLASARNPDLFEKEGDSLYQRGGPPVASAAPEMFVRQRQLNLKPVDKPNDTGSLFNPEDERNFLFTSSAPLNVGRFLTIKVVDNRKKAGAAGANETNPATPATAAADDKSKKSGDEVEEALIKALPDLEPAKRSEVALLDSFKMKISHRYPNGDVQAMLTRSSNSEDQATQAEVQARIPYDRLIAGDTLTTDDLLDVKFLDSREGEVVERRSSGWEDEYSLRLSGFTEAKSKAAMALDDKQRQLEQTSENLRERIKAMGTERRQLAKQREELSVKAAKDAQKMEEVERKLDEQKSTIETQNSTIQEQQKAIEEVSKSGEKEAEGGGANPT